MNTVNDNIAIEVQGLSKKYSLGSSHTDLKISDKVKGIFKSRKISSETENHQFYALKDLHFKIYQGETIGIIGRNGAGKSTLLKVLSQITEPTEGRVIINGTIASVLEVGMGFHPDLTGRENIFMGGAMLGIPKNKIEERFDEIVEFAGMQRFIDTAVKHYSSGMYVRLAFSVVVNIEADILLFDEVLSVGDYSFQMKCYEKICKLAGSNKTILIVSHNNNDILALCSKVMYLEKGKILDFGDTSIVMKYFEKSISESPPINDNSTNSKPLSEYRYENKLITEWENRDEAPGDDKIKLSKMFVCNESREGSNTINTNENFSINFEYEKYSDDDYYDIGFNVANMNFIFLANHLGNSDLSLKNYTQSGKYHIKMYVEKNFFNETIISIGFFIYRNDETLVCYDTNTLHVKIEKAINSKDDESIILFKNYNLPLKPQNMKWEVFRLQQE